MTLTNLIDNLNIRQLRLWVLRVVRPHKNTDDILPVACLLAFLDDLPGRLPDKVEIMPEAGVLTAWKVTKEVEDRLRQVAPCRLEDHVEFGGIESRVDARSWMYWTTIQQRC